MTLGGFFAGFLRGLAAFSALSAGSAAFFLRPFGASEGSPAFLRPAARRGCVLSCSARASSRTTASVKRYCLGRLVAGDRGVDAVVADVRTVATVLDDNRAAFVGVFAQNLAGIGAEAAALLRVGLLFRDQGHGAVESDGEDIVAVFQVRVSLAVLHIRTKASNAGEDRLAVFRRQADFTWQ